MRNSIKAMIKTAWLFLKIGQQTGVFIFLINAMSSIVRNNPGYIWVVDNKTSNANALALLDTRIGYELASVEGVEKVYPMVMAGGAARFSNGTNTGVTLIGAQAPEFAGGPWNIYVGKKDDLLQDNAVFTDNFDKKSLGGVQLGDHFEINGHEVFNAGLTSGVRAFGGGVYVFTTIERARYLGNVPVNKASAFLIKRKPNVSEDEVIASINKSISGITAWKSSDFAKETVITVLKISGIAISYGTLILFALIVGFVIIGLTLYSSALDRIKDYGTLKAIGAYNKFIRNLIITQALIFAIAGYAIGTMFVEGFRNGLARAGVFFNYPAWLRISFLLVTILIALLGCSFAIRRIIKLEPAAVFRG